MDQREQQKQFEDRFLQQLRARAEVLARGVLPADRVQTEFMPDGLDSVRATLARLERYDRDLLERLPGTRALQFRFQRRVLGPFRKTVARLRAQVLAPIEELIADEPARPVGREAVLDALARYELLPQSQRPTDVAFASPTGFTAEARSLVGATGTPTLILMGGREDGGWDVTMPDTLKRTAWARLFELESQDERFKRFMYHLEKNATQLESRGISLSALAEQAGLGVAQTETLVRQACRNDPRLMTVTHEGRTHLCRSPLAEESKDMKLPIWLRKLLRMKPTIGERVSEMTAQRVRLEQQRHELDQRVDALESEERKLVEQGGAAKSDAERKQLAGKLVRTRRELRRARAQANMFTQQIDIIGTHIHHLTLAEQGKRMDLPSAEDLTQEAAQAEQMVNELAANADLAAHIEVGAQSPMAAEEEAAILKEFEQASAAPEPEKPTSAAPEQPPTEQTPAEPERPATEKDKSARPELG